MKVSKQFLNTILKYLEVLTEVGVLVYICLIFVVGGNVMTNILAYITIVSYALSKIISLEVDR